MPRAVVSIVVACPLHPRMLGDPALSRAPIVQLPEDSLVPGATPRPRFRPARDLAIAFGFGAITVAGFAPLYFFPLPVLTLAFLFGLCERATFS